LKDKIIAVAGPTASGKTALAIEIAERIGGEVISNDSMQIYRGMEIGTAAPTKEEMRGIPHHMIGIADPSEEFSCADYSAIAKNKISEIIQKGKIPVFCGGTGLYLDSVLSRGDMSESEKNDALREELSSFAEKYGNLALHDRLRAVDPESADAIHQNNVRRVIRALEIYETTGITKSEWDKRSRKVELPYEVHMAIIEFADRELLYSRIEKRVDIMMAQGVLKEARALFEKGLLKGDKPAAQAIGYKEFVPCFEGKQSLDEAILAIKQNTRRYAKRQITWFKKYSPACRLIPDRNGILSSAAELAQEFLEREKFI